MKDFIVLEVNNKKECLGNITINTPNEFLLVNSAEPVLNNRIFDAFVDELFLFITQELANEFDKKIDNVYTTLIDDNDNFVLSIVLDKFKPKKGVYRMRIIDWESSGYTFKYAEEDIGGSDDNIKMA